MSQTPKENARQVWAEFCDALKASGDVILHEETADAALDVPEGFRFLTRALRYQLEKSIEGNDTSFPWLVRSSHENLKMLSDSPDYHYRFANIDGRYAYRLHGTRGGADLVAVSTYGPGGAGVECQGSLQELDLKIKPDGTFEVILSTREHTGNWLPMKENATFMQLRNIFSSHHRDTPSIVTLERIDAPLAPEPYDSERLIADLKTASMQMKMTLPLIARFARNLREKAFNAFDHDQTLWRAAGGNTDTYYVQGYWEIAEDEVLIVDCTVPTCSYFSFQLNNVWAESLDYLHHTIYRTNHNSQRRRDGSVRYVIAHRDPHIDADWIDTAGHRSGTMVWKWNGITATPNPVARKMKIDELDSLK
jgi:hypothetical protein